MHNNAFWFRYPINNSFGGCHTDLKADLRSNRSRWCLWSAMHTSLTQPKLSFQQSMTVGDNAILANLAPQTSSSAAHTLQRAAAACTAPPPRQYSAQYSRTTPPRPATVSATVTQ